MATIAQINNRITDFNSRTGAFSIEKGEFFACMSDIVGKISDINNALNAAGVITGDPGGFVALAGTQDGAPITGDLEFTGNTGIFSNEGGFLQFYNSAAIFGFQNNLLFANSAGFYIADSLYNINDSKQIAVKDDFDTFLALMHHWDGAQIYNNEVLFNDNVYYKGLAAGNEIATKGDIGNFIANQVSNEWGDVLFSNFDSYGHFSIQSSRITLDGGIYPTSDFPHSSQLDLSDTGFTLSAIGGFPTIEAGLSNDLTLWSGRHKILEYSDSNGFMRLNDIYGDEFIIGVGSSSLLPSGIYYGIVPVGDMVIGRSGYKVYMGGANPGNEVATINDCGGAHWTTKEVNIGTLPNSNTATVEIAHNISNIMTKQIKKITGYAKNSTNIVALPHVSRSSINDNIQVVLTATSVLITTGKDRSEFTEAKVYITYK